MEEEFKERMIGSEEVLSALGMIEEKEWEEASYPVITYVPKETFSKFVVEKSGNYKEKFWSQIFDVDRYARPGTLGDYDSEKDLLFILHNPEGDSKFKAITTTHQNLLKEARFMINYNYHGKPCEKASRGSYPTCDFWSFYDGLEEVKKDRYPIPDYNWRKKFVEDNYIKKKS